MSAPGSPPKAPVVLRIPGITRLPFVPLVIGLYAVARAISFVILTIVAGHQVPTGMSGGDDVPVNYLGFLAMWDGQWYQRIAEGGYPAQLPRDALGEVEQNEWAFYPMLPMLSRLLMIVTGWSFNASAGFISLACGFGAAVIMALLLRDRLGTLPALAVTFLWSNFPTAVTLQIAYSEALAMLVLTAYLLALSRERWLIATGLAVLVGLTRPIAVPLALVALVAVWLRWRDRAARPVTRTEWAAMGVAVGGTGVAGFIWPAIVWLGTGVRSGYTDTMGAWRAGRVVTPFVPWADMARWLFGEDRGMPVLVALIVGLVAMVAGPWARGLGPQLRAWSLAYPAYLGVVLDPFTSVFRYLLPLFPLVAVLLGVGWREPRRDPRRARVLLVARLVPLLVLSIMGQWYWTDILYQFSPPSDYPP